MLGQGGRKNKVFVMGVNKAIKNNIGNDILQMAKTKRHIYLLERIQKGKTLTNKELKELEEFESKGKNSSKKKVNDNIADTIPQLSAAVGATSRTIRNWIGEGMPVRPDKTYDIDAVRNWRHERDNRRKPSAQEEIDLKIKQARLRELEDQEKVRAGLYISREEEDKRDAAKVLAVKQQLLAIPRAMAKTLEHLEARQIEAILKNKMHEVIKKFSGQ